MFIVYYMESDEWGYYQRSVRVDNEYQARAYVARLKFNGHQEAFYRAA